MTAISYTLFDEPLAKPLSQYGVPMPGAYYLFYFTGTLVPAPVYSSSGAVLSQTPGQAQPSCTADANGRFNAIYMNPANTYRVQLYNSSGQLQEDTDPYQVPVSYASLAGSTGTGTFSLTDGVNSTTVNFQYKLAQDGTTCTLAVGSGVFTSGSTTLQLNLLTGTFPTITGAGNSYHQVPAENSGGYITATAEVQFGSTIYLYANPTVGLSTWTASGQKGLPVGFTITYNTLQTLTEH